MITIHAVDPADLLQLVRGVRGENQNWERFYQRALTKYELIRLGRISSLGNLPLEETNQLSVEEAAKKLDDIYNKAPGLSLKAKHVLRFGRRRLGLSDAIHTLKSYYLKGPWEEFELEFGFVAAQMAHVSHPTWRTDNVNISFLWRLGWDPLRQRGENVAALLGNQQRAKPHPIEASYSAGIYLSPERLREIRAIFHNLQPDLFRLMESKQMPSVEYLPEMEVLDQAMAFADRKGCGLLEARDVVIEDGEKYL